MSRCANIFLGEAGSTESKIQGVLRRVEFDSV